METGKNNVKGWLLAIMLLIVAVPCAAQSTDVAALEETADNYAKKSYTHQKAFQAYLRCFRLYGTKAKSGQQGVLKKVTALLDSRSSLMNRDVPLVDSLIAEARPAYGTSTDVFLPLIEQRIIKSMNSTGKYQAEFVLIDEALALRRQHKMLKGAGYEQLLRKYTDILTYKTHMSKKEKSDLFSELWKVYLDNNAGKDTLDLKLLDKYAQACHFADDLEQETKLHELKREYMERTNTTDSEEYRRLLGSLLFDYSRLHTARHGDKDYTMTPEVTKELEYYTRLFEAQRTAGVEWESTTVSGYVTTVCIHRGDTLKARKVATEYATAVEQKHGKESQEYCSALGNVAETYADADASVIPVLEELLTLKEKVYGTEHTEYELTKMKLSSVYSQTHRKGDAISLMEQDANDDILKLTMLATEQKNYGNYRASIETYGRMMERMAAHPEERGLNYFSAVLGAINSFDNLKDLEGLLAFGNKWTTDGRLSASEQKLVFVQVAGTAARPGRSGDALLNFIDKYQLSHPEAMATPQARAEIMELKTVALAAAGRAAQAADVMRSTVSELERAHADARLIIHYKLLWEVCIMAQDKVDEAIALNQATLQQMQQLPGYETTAEYLSLCCRAAIYQDKKDNFDEVLRLCSLIDNFDTKHATSLNPSNVFSIHILSVLINTLTSSSVEEPRYRAFYNKGMKPEAEKLISQTLPHTVSLIRFTLDRLDNSNQKSTDLWLRQVNDNLNNITLLVGSDSLAIKAYNYALLYKQAFLTAEHLMRQQLLGSGNSQLKAKFEELQNLRTTIVQQEAAGLPVAELRERSRQLEKQLVEDSKVYGDFTSGLNMTWQDVQRSLEADDIAIEFLAYTSFDDNQEHLAALLLRPAWKAPRIVHLFASSQIPKDAYGDTQFACLCWNPIIPYLEGVRNIYFAPAGELYNIGIESLPSPDGKSSMASNYNLYRISSTRELSRRHDNAAADRNMSVVYGGITYDAAIKDPVAAVASESESEPLSRDVRGAIGKVAYLPATKVEAESIADILGKEGKGTTIRLVTGAEGTETSFKALNGQQLRIAHISTHGFYDKSHAKASDNPAMFILEQQDTEDKALARSGLLFAGASNTLQGKKAANGTDDGILTAQEISAIDLRGLNLVALSACQTAQGEIRGDGVFGLQRGFKKAGANTILMSLWKVDDEATCLLMTEFYRNWIVKGKTKHDALEQAKQTVRSHKEKGWNHPQYWAAFILLDGLD